VVLVAASGNEASAVGYPAALPGVIAVGAVQVGKKVPRYSNGGSGLDVVAPGGNTNRDDNGDGEPDGILQETVESGHWDYEYYDSTSMATPHVSGLAALLLSAGAHRDDVPDLIRSTAEPLGGGDWNRRWGYGLIDPVAALEAIPTGPGEPEEPWEPPVTGDDTPPEISDIESRRKRRTLTLWWTTDEPATSQVLFAGYGRYGDLELVRHHELRFTIDRSETYEFQLVSEDEIGNEAYSEWFVTEP